MPTFMKRNLFSVIDMHERTLYIAHAHICQYVCILHIAEMKSKMFMSFKAAEKAYLNSIKFPMKFYMYR